LTARDAIIIERLKLLRLTNPDRAAKEMARNTLTTNFEAVAP